MDLITGMFQFNPKLRYSMAEIITHPWVQGETATVEEIKEEFAARQLKLSSYKKAMLAREGGLPIVPTVFDAHMDEEDEEDSTYTSLSVDEEDQATMEQDEIRQPFVFCPKGKNGTQLEGKAIMGRVGVDTLYKGCRAFVEQNATTFEESPTHMEMEGKYQKTQKNEDDVCMKFKVVKIKDNLNCVDVKRVEGEPKVFNATFKAF